MKIEIKTFQCEVKETNEANNVGTVEGFASTFGNVDLGGDIVDKGAFKKTLKESKGKFPILADHSPYQPIGYNVSAEETDQGLKVTGELNLDVQLGRERYSLAKQAMRLNAPLGLSIGYLTIKAEPDKDMPQVRRLKELRLVEYSLVTFPMNPKAMITAAKSWIESSGDVDPEEFTALLIEQMKKMGINGSRVFEALQKSEVASGLDSDLLIQSVDNVLKILKA